MAELTPTDVFERFSGDLEAAARQVVQSGEAEAKAQTAGEQAIIALEDAQMVHEVADARLSSLRNTVIGAVESTTEDPSDRSALGAIMMIRGSSVEEVDSYFTHLDRLQSEEQPIAIVAGATALSGASARLTYGETVKAASPDDGVRLVRDSQIPGSRSVTIPISSPRGFLVDPIPQVSFYNVFATGPDTIIPAEPTVVNNNHPFDRLHLAGTADEVDTHVEQALEAEERSAADNAAMDLLSVPTMVAYGEEAIGRLAIRVTQERPSLRAAIWAAAYGLDLGYARPTLPLSQEDTYTKIFERALRGVLWNESGSDSLMAFWAPLQELVEYSPTAALDKLAGEMLAVYSPRTHSVITGEYDDRWAVENQLRKTAQLANSLGAHVACSDSNIKYAAEDVRRRVITKRLDETPRRKIFARHRMQQAVY